MAGYQLCPVNNRRSDLGFRTDVHSRLSCRTGLTAPLLFCITHPHPLLLPMLIMLTGRAKRRAALIVATEFTMVVTPLRTPPHALMPLYNPHDCFPRH